MSMQFSKYDALSTFTELPFVMQVKLFISSKSLLLKLSNPLDKAKKKNHNFCYFIFHQESSLPCTCIRKLKGKKISNNGKKYEYLIMINDQVPSKHHNSSLWISPRRVIKGGTIYNSQPIHANNLVVWLHHSPNMAASMIMPDRHYSVYAKLF